MEDTLFTQLGRKMLKELRKDPEKFEHIQNEMNGEKSCLELFTLIWDLKEAHKTLKQRLLPPEKCEANADRLRIQANSAYKLKNYDKALEEYNLSILVSPHPILYKTPNSWDDKEEEDDFCLPKIMNSTQYFGNIDGECSALAMGFANRSAVLFKLKLYEECLHDITLAVYYGYPEGFMKTLEDRTVKCLKFLEKEEEDINRSDEESSSSARKSVPATFSVDVGSAKPTKGGRPSTMDDLVSETQSLSLRSVKAMALKKIILSKVQKPPEVKERSDTVPVLSSAVKVSYDSIQGRHLTATRDMRPGDVIAVEEAYCVSIIADMLPLYCITCMHLTLNPVPCPACNKVVFCNEVCRSRGLAEDHWIECSILPTIIALGIMNRSLSYKMLKTFSYRRLKDMINGINQEKGKELQTSEEPMKFEYFSSSSYRSNHHLITNKEKLPFEFLFVQCQQAFIFTNLLWQSGRFFVDDDGVPVKPGTKDLLATGAIILCNIMKIRCNAFEIVDVKMKRTIGAAMFPTLSLINHSCNPAARVYNCGREMVVRAVRPIRAGEEVTISYTCVFSQQRMDSRAADLTLYNFTCSCEACENKWGLYSDLPVVKRKAVRKGKKEHADKIAEAVIKARDIEIKIVGAAEISDEDFRYLIESIELMYEHVPMPSQNTCNMQNLLYNSFLFGK